MRADFGFDSFLCLFILFFIIIIFFWCRKPWWCSKRRRLQMLIGTMQTYIVRHVEVLIDPTTSSEARLLTAKLLKQLTLSVFTLYSTKSPKRGRRYVQSNSVNISCSGVFLIVNGDRWLPSFVTNLSSNRIYTTVKSTLERLSHRFKIWSSREKKTIKKRKENSTLGKLPF